MERQSLFLLQVYESYILILRESIAKSLECSITRYWFDIKRSGWKTENYKTRGDTSEVGAT